MCLSVLPFVLVSFILASTFYFSIWDEAQCSRESVCLSRYKPHHVFICVTSIKPVEILMENLEENEHRKNIQVTCVLDNRIHTKTLYLTVLR
jgi:hypothetical protein